MGGVFSGRWTCCPHPFPSVLCRCVFLTCWPIFPPSPCFQPHMVSLRLPPFSLVSIFQCFFPPLVGHNMFTFWVSWIVQSNSFSISSCPHSIYGSSHLILAALFKRYHFFQFFPLVPFSQRGFFFQPLAVRPGLWFYYRWSFPA